MNRISKILNSTLFRRILVIFVVGLISRNVVNSAFDINVFKEYDTIISLVYYGFMACFSAIVHELPMGVPLHTTDGVDNLSNTTAFFSKSNIDSDKNISAGVKGIYTNKTSNSRPSAAMRGLYSPEYNKDSIGKDYPGFGRKCKARFLWTFKQWSREFGSYKEYSQHLGKDFSMKVELKNIFRKS